jgi:hypothetical protein
VTAVDEVEEATKCTGELTVAPLEGELTVTPAKDADSNANIADAIRSALLKTVPSR